MRRPGPTRRRVNFISSCHSAMHNASPGASLDIPLPQRRTQNPDDADASAAEGAKGRAAFGRRGCLRRRMQHQNHMTLAAAHHDLSESSIPAGAAPKSQKAQKRARQKARKVGAEPANMDASEDAHGSGAMNGGGSGGAPGVVPREAQPPTAADTTFREVSQPLGTLAAADNSAECFVLVPSDAKSQGRHAWHSALGMPCSGSFGQVGVPAVHSAWQSMDMGGLAQANAVGFFICSCWLWFVQYTGCRSPPSFTAVNAPILSCSRLPGNR